MTLQQPTTETSLDEVRRGLGLTAIALSCIGLVTTTIALLGSAVDGAADEFGLGYFVAFTTAAPALIALVLGLIALRGRNAVAGTVVGIVGIALAVEPVKDVGRWILGLAF